MAAFFTGVVRAPLTGVLLVTEMTANATMLLPMLVACFAAMLVPTLLRNAPIYESLREHTLRGENVLQQKTQKNNWSRAGPLALAGLGCGPAFIQDGAHELCS